MLNPGSGESRTDSADCRARRLIRAFTAGERTLRDVLGHIQTDAKNWGRGRFIDFYSTDLRLDFETLAFANVAWCSTIGNHYPPEMLHACFTHHTSELLQILRPDIVLLSGAAVRRFIKKINKLLPSAAIITTFHFAHRKGNQAWLTEVARVRQRIRGLSKKIATKHQRVWS
jgi:SAM-dependent methyltransferase